MKSMLASLSLRSPRLSVFFSLFFIFLLFFGRIVENKVCHCADVEKEGVLSCPFSLCNPAELIKIDFLEKGELNSHHHHPHYHHQGPALM